MKKLFTIVGILLFAGLANNVMAQGASQTTDAKAEVITPITLVKSGELDFGKIAIAPGSTGTVVISSDGATRTATGNASTISTAFAFPTYTVGGAISLGYTITVPAISVTTTATGTGSKTMTIAPSSKSTSVGVGTAGTLSGTGADTFTVGGTLSMAADQVPGSYTGTFAVSVNYN